MKRISADAKSGNRQQVWYLACRGATLGRPPISQNTIWPGSGSGKSEGLAWVCGGVWWALRGGSYGMSLASPGLYLVRCTRNTYPAENKS